MFTFARNVELNGSLMSIITINVEVHDTPQLSGAVCIDNVVHVFATSAE